MRSKWATLLVVIGVIIGFLAGLGAAGYAHPKPEEKIEVFAGAAALPVYEEAIKLFESKYGVKVELVSGSMGSIITAMNLTKRGDVFFSPSADYTLKAIKLGLIDNSTVKRLAYMVPAIIVQRGNPKNITSLEDLAKPGIRVGIADPQTVVVGAYAKEILEREGLWEKVKGNIVVYARDAPSLASLIPMKSVDAVIGWHVFKAWYPNESEIIWIEPGKVPRIAVMSGAISKFAKNRDMAMMFLNFFESPEVMEIWRKYGYFATLEEARAHAPNAELDI